jgi:hypothetical protein
MPNLTPILRSTVAKFGNKEPVNRVILNPEEAVLLKSDGHFSRTVPPGCLMGSAIGRLNESILVLEWNLIPKGTVSILEGGEIGLYGSLSDLKPDPHFYVPLHYGKEPLYELGEEVWVEANPDHTQIGIIQGVLKVDSFDQVQMCLLRTHHLNVIEGPMPENMLGVSAGIYYWITKTPVWVPESGLSPRSD